MKNAARRNILAIQPYIPGKPIEEVKRELGLKRVIKLASNENPYPPSPKVLKAIREAAKDINRYPDGNCYYLRQALSKELSVASNQIIFGNGSDEIIVMATKAFVNPGDEVIIAQPSFLIYEIASRVADAQVRLVPLKDFRYDLEGMKKAVSAKTKIIFIGNPDNPSGTYITSRQALDFLNSIPQNILVFFDEAYFEFVNKKDYPDTISFLKSFKNVITTRTFSKIYGLAGLRIGYGIADSEVIDILERVREPFNINSLAQAAAIACLKDKAYYRKILKILEKQRQYLRSQFKKLGLTFVDTATNFMQVNVKSDSLEFSKKLLRQGVIVRDMSAWGLKTYIRITIGTESENKILIQALERIVK